jgi:hypothetical protein
MSRTMPDVSGPEPKLSALPTARARVLAFVAIIVAGLAGGMIGWSFADLQCTGDCGTASGVGAIVGGTTAAVGVAVVAVLALRAMGEWRRIQESAHPDDAPPNASNRNPSA